MYLNKRINFPRRLSTRNSINKNIIKKYLKSRCLRPSTIKSINNIFIKKQKTPKQIKH